MSTSEGDRPIGNASPRADEPEFGHSRRRFLIAMFMCGAVSSERVVERVVADIEREVQAGTADGSSV